MHVRAKVIGITLLALLAYSGDLIATQRTAHSTMTDALVIMDEAQVDDVLLRVGQLVTVTQRLPPRLAVVQGEAARLETVRNLPGVVAVYEGPVPETALQGLADDERTFAEAWTLTRQAKPNRRGDRLPWDAEGFQPPDALDRSPKR